MMASLSSILQLIVLCLASLIIPINSLSCNQHYQNQVRNNNNNIYVPIHQLSLQQQRHRRTISYMSSVDDDIIDENEKNDILEYYDDAELIEVLQKRASDIDNEQIIKSAPTAAPTIATTKQNIGRKRRMQMYTYLSQPIVEVQIIGLVFISCFLQAINTLDDLPIVIHDGIDVVDSICVYVFAVEFILRWWSAGRFQLRYLAKPLASVDAIVVILPLILSGILPMLLDLGVDIPIWLLSSAGSSALLNLRLLRILKFQRVLTNQRTFADFQMALGIMDRKTDVRPYQLQLARVIISIFTLVSVSTGLIYTAEHEVNPEIPDYFTALYFGLTTLTTVGFGDIVPITPQGRTVVSGTILAGVAIIPAQAAALADAFVSGQMEKDRRGATKKKKKRRLRQKCSKCGEGPHRNDAIYCWSCGELLD